MIKSRSIFFLMFLFICYACPEASILKYTAIDSEKALIHQKDSVFYDINYVNFFTRRKQNLIRATFRFKTNESFDKRKYNITLTSKEFGVIKTFDEQPLDVKTNYQSYFNNEENVITFYKIMDKKKSIRKLKKDTITLTINNSSYYFINKSL